MGNPGSPKEYLLSDFETLRTLGHGSFGVVKEVVHCKTRDRYAMKILDKTRIVERGLENQLRREVLIQLRAKHPNIVRMYYYFEEPDRVHCLLEYADKGQLFAYLRDFPSGLPEPRAAAIFSDVANGVAYLHRVNVAHRDLKPENIMLFGEAPTAKVADLGWCCELTDSRPDRHTFCGTPDYLSPEMWLSEPHGTAVDLWALGVLLFELLLARPPFAAASPKDAMELILQASPKFPENSVSSEPQELILGLLQRDQKNRTPISQVLAHPWLGGGSQVFSSPSSASLASSTFRLKFSSPPPSPSEEDERLADSPPQEQRQQQQQQQQQQHQQPISPTASPEVASSAVRRLPFTDASPTSVGLGFGKASPSNTTPSDVQRDFCLQRIVADSPPSDAADQRAVKALSGSPLDADLQWEFRGEEGLSFFPKNTPPANLNETVVFPRQAGGDQTPERNPQTLEGVPCSFPTPSSPSSTPEKASWRKSSRLGAHLPSEAPSPLGRGDADWQQQQQQQQQQPDAQQQRQWRSDTTTSPSPITERWMSGRPHDQFGMNRSNSSRDQRQQSQSSSNSHNYSSNSNGNAHTNYNSTSTTNNSNTNNNYASCGSRLPPADNAASFRASKSLPTAGSPGRELPAGGVGVCFPGPRMGKEKTTPERGTILESCQDFPKMHREELQDEGLGLGLGDVTDFLTGLFMGNAGVNAGAGEAERRHHPRRSTRKSHHCSSRRETKSENAAMFTIFG